jgi:hypothetical protein
MDWMIIFALPLTVFAFFYGIACIINGPSIATIEKHYHYEKAGEQNEKSNT